jgi:hypothetical protein
MTIKLTKNYFSGTSKVFDASPVGLAALLRGIVIDNVRTYFKSNAVTALTDSTGGTATPLVVNDIHIPPVNTATGSLGEAEASLATSMGKIKNATLVLMNSVNGVRKKLGLPIFAYAEGTQASANVLPAQDLSGTGTATLTSVVDFSSAASAMRNAKVNIRTLVEGINDIAKAFGQPVLVSAIKSAPLTVPTNPVLLQGNINTSPDGTNSMLVTDVTNFLLESASAFASIAAFWNEFVAKLEPTAFTDSTGGTAAGALVAVPIPAPATGAATTSAPKAGFDTALAGIANDVASLAAIYNEFAEQSGLPTIVDGSTGTASTTLASLSVALTAVDGSSGTVAVDVVTATTEMENVGNDLSTLNKLITELCTVSDVPPPGPDASGNNAGLESLAAISATGAGVSGVNATMLNSAVDTWLSDTRNNISTLAAFLNTVNTQDTSIPFNVVAG